MATDNVAGAVAAARQLLAALYDPKNTFKDEHTSLNTVRVRMAEKHVPLDKLPPSGPSFGQHLKRASYESGCWLILVSLIFRHLMGRDGREKSMT
jgi:hypothetical protein